MEHFWEAAAAIIIAVVLWIILSKQGKEFSLGVSIVACCIVLILTSRYLDPLLDFISKLEYLAGFQAEWIAIVLKAVGIGLVVEVGSLICIDAGNAVLAKVLQIVGSIVMLWLGIPLMSGLLDLVQQILGGL